MTREKAILIVDDDPATRGLLAHMVADQAGRLLFAGSAEEALETIGTQPLDLILLDVMLPEMDGYELCERLKADSATRHIPVVLITGLDSDEALVRGFDAGADEFISKPVRAVPLRARVRSMLRIKQQYDELLGALKLREDLAHMLVHDMRSPLQALMAAGEMLMLRGEVVSEVGQRTLAEISNQSQRLHSFLNDLLMTAKFEGDRVILNRTAARLDRLAERVIAASTRTAESRRIRLEHELPTEPLPLIEIDVNLVERVLENLISNALKYAPRGSAVTVRLGALPAAESPGCAGDDPPAGGPRVRLEVRDQGDGVPEEHRMRIFEKFEVVNLRRQGVCQVGLGLPFCRLVVEAHGGRIWVEPNQPTGAAFFVEL